MGLLKLGSAAIVGSALTLLVVSGPGNLGTTVKQAAAPVVSTVEQTAGQVVGSSARRSGRRRVRPSARPALRPSPPRRRIGQQTQQATGQASAETTVRVYQDNRPSVVTVISSVVPARLPLRPAAGRHRLRLHHRRSGPHPDQQPRRRRGRQARSDALGRHDLPGEAGRARLPLRPGRDPGRASRPTSCAPSSSATPISSQVGEQVVAIGNPYGLDGTVTTGIVSGRRPLVSEPEGDGVLVNAIQTDTSINPGNSGGPLLNARGEVIGVTTLGLMPNGGQAGLNFAIPINNAKRILNDLMAKGSYAHPFVGIGTAEITSTVAEQLSLPVKEGLLVQSVDPNSGGGEGRPQGRLAAAAAGRRPPARGRRRHHRRG